MKDRSGSDCRAHSSRRRTVFAVWKGRTLGLILGLIVVSSAVIAICGTDSSDAASYGDVYICSEWGQLKDAVNNANSDDDHDKIVISSNIEVAETILITKPLTLTAATEGVKLSPAGNFSGADTNNVMIKAQDTVFIIGESTDSPALELNGGGKCRVVAHHFGGSTNKLTVNSVFITNGYHVRNGAGLFVSNGADWEMNGGRIVGNKLGPQGTTTDIRFSQDVWCGAATDFTMNGGEIGLLLSNCNVDHDGSMLMKGGSIDSVYVCSHGPSGHISTLTYKGGSIEHVLISTVANTGSDLTTFSYSEVEQPLIKDKQYKAGSHVAQVGQYGYETLQEAIDAAKEGDTIIIIHDIEITDPTIIPKGVDMKVAVNYNTGSAFDLTYSENLAFTVAIDLDGFFMFNPTGWTSYTKSFAYGTPWADIVADINANINNEPVKRGFKFLGWTPAAGTLGPDSPTVVKVESEAYSEKGYEVEIAAVCALEALIVIGIAAIVRRR